VSERGKRGPRKLGGVMREVSAAIGPATPLGRVQAAWAAAAGPEFAARCVPVAERDGVVTVICESAVWAQELDLRQAEITSRLGEEAGIEGVRSLRVRTGDTGS
jgi:predicted nucleic acid-binding Zn ribbon protein